MNRITKQKLEDWGFWYAPSESRANELGNAQVHDHGIMIVGPNDAREGVEPAIKGICADVESAKAKLNHDTCDKIEFNAPIVFETKYNAKDHLLNGQPVYGVLLTGKRIK